VLALLRPGKEGILYVVAVSSGMPLENFHQPIIAYPALRMIVARILKVADDRGVESD
jgi:hypothetical protein